MAINAEVLINAINSRLRVREQRWVIADLMGKGKHIRTVPVPVGAKRAVDDSTTAEGIGGGAIFRRVSRLGRIWGEAIMPNPIWHVVKAAAKRASIKDLAPMTCVAPVTGYAIWRAENLSRFSFCLGTHQFRQPSRYLGCKQRISEAVNDNLGLKDP